MLNKKYLKVELDFNFILLAITSQMKDYRLCFLINKHTEMEFKKEDDLSLDFIDMPVKYFSQFIYVTEHTECKFNLIENKGSEGYLIPEMKEYDYFIMIENFIDEEELALFISQIKSINEIQAVVEINPEKLKSKENLIF